MKHDIEEVAKRRGFFWQSSEIYGGMSGFYDYGHLGALVKRKWETLWRSFFLGLDDNFVEIEPTTIMHENTFVGSGHLKCFVDPVTKCKKCGHTERADQILEEILKEKFEGLSTEKLSELIKKHKVKCPNCGGALEGVEVFNMLFPVDVGVENQQRAYLRGETAQGAYVNFPRIFQHLRKKMPLGVAVVGRAYRNEISPRNLLIRMREFSQAELQIFFDPEKIKDHHDFDSVSSYKLLVNPLGKKKTEKISCQDIVKKLKLPKFYVYYLAKVQQFYLDVVGISEKNFRLLELSEEERAFYNKYHWDIELKSEKTWKECGGVHYRTDHDLSGHQDVSKEKMTVSVDGSKFVPHVLELSFGVDRNIFTLLESSYEEEEERSVLKFPRKLSPYDCGIFPLVKKEKLPEMAKKIQSDLEKVGFNAFYDESGSIGRRYRRMDEIGVPISITIDFDSVKDKDVTIRDRDSMKQIRVPLKKLGGVIFEFLNGKDLKDF